MTTNAEVRKEAGLFSAIAQSLSDGPEFEFVKDTIKNAILFLLIAALAIALNYLVNLLKSTGISKFILWGLEGLEYLIFVADVVWFVSFLIVSTILLVRNVWSKVTHNQSLHRIADKSGSR